jgi:hypothetical protein
LEVADADQGDDKAADASPDRVTKNSSKRSLAGRSLDGSKRSLMDATPTNIKESKDE